ncbi:hypothetical protein JYT22_01115, partial [Endomicrobium sp. AH-315-J14]|nr:hypothetical protein [Endomicrobium sp. AH-315-J14]
AAGKKAPPPAAGAKAPPPAAPKADAPEKGLSNLASTIALDPSDAPPKSVEIDDLDWGADEDEAAAPPSPPPPKGKPLPPRPKAPPRPKPTPDPGPVAAADVDGEATLALGVMSPKASAEPDSSETEVTTMMALDSVLDEETNATVDVDEELLADADDPATEQDDDGDGPTARLGDFIPAAEATPPAAEATPAADLFGMAGSEDSSPSAPEAEPAAAKATPGASDAAAAAPDAAASPWKKPDAVEEEPTSKPLSWGAMILLTLLTAALVMAVGIWLTRRQMRITGPPPAAATASASSKSATSQSASATTKATPPTGTASAKATPSATATASATASASAAPAADDGRDGSALPPKMGYLKVNFTGPPGGAIYLRGKRLGAVAEKIETKCGFAFIRVGKEPGPQWLSAGVSVAIKCQAVTEVTVAK